MHGGCAQSSMPVAAGISVCPAGISVGISTGSTPSLHPFLRALPLPHLGRDDPTFVRPKRVRGGSLLGAGRSLRRKDSHQIG
jgi:hypothetical protein